ncbi:MAG: RDD family protein [Candidatus Bathyarchaeota archaeon]
MTTDKDNVSKIFLILSHKLRRDILFNLSEKKEQSFSDLMNALNIDTGRMSFHLRNLKPFLEQSSGMYKLTSFGETAVRIIRDVESLSIEANVLKKGGLHLASFYKRMIAFIFDMGVAFTITVATTLVGEFFVLFSGQFVFDQNFFFYLGLLWLYSTLLEGFAGQTVGKLLLNLKVINVTGNRLFYDGAAVRNFGKCFLLPIDLLLGLFLHDKRFIKFFDKISRTTVIQI